MVQAMKGAIDDRRITKQSMVHAMDHEAVEGDMDQEAVEGAMDGASDDMMILG